MNHEESPRKYTYNLSALAGKDYDLFTIEEWKAKLRSGELIPSDGQGFFVKGGYESTVDAMWEHEKDATHVAWYNK